MDLSKISMQKINSLPIFLGLSAEEIKAILNKDNVSIKFFRKSEYIYLAGDCIDNLCIVLNGTVQMIKEDIWGDRCIITSFSEGVVFAENFLGQGCERSIVSYLAVSDSEILMLPLKKILDEEDFRDTKLVSNILTALADNNTQLLKKTEIVCKKTLRDKILTYLEQEIERQGSEIVELPFNRTDLANYLDADRSALTRELSRMREEGLIEFEKNSFKILKGQLCSAQ